MKELMHKLDPLGNRPVSANQNGWVGTDTPLDVRGMRSIITQKCHYLITPPSFSSPLLQYFSEAAYTSYHLCVDLSQSTLDVSRDAG